MRMRSVFVPSLFCPQIRTTFNEGRTGTLRMIWGDAQVGKKQLLAAGMMAPTAGLNSHKHRINIRQCFWILGFKHPPFLACVIFIEYSEIQSLLFVGSAPAPSLTLARITHTRLRVELVRMANQRLSLWVENASVSLVRLHAPTNVANHGDVQAQQAHQLAIVPVVVDL